MYHKWQYHVQHHCHILNHVGYQYMFLYYFIHDTIEMMAIISYDIIFDITKKSMISYHF